MAVVGISVRPCAGEDEEARSLAIHNIVWPHRAVTMDEVQSFKEACIHYADFLGAVDGEEKGSAAIAVLPQRPKHGFLLLTVLEDGRRLYLIADGRLVNLSAAEGHPAQVMDMSFANQAFSAEYVVSNAASLEKKVYPVPEEIDREIARLKLETMGVTIDRLTEEQAKYLASWDEGT